MQTESHDMEENNMKASRLPSLTGDYNKDWCLWQLVQVLKEIAQLRAKENAGTKDEGE